MSSGDDVMLNQKIYIEQQATDKLEVMGLSADDFVFAISRAIYESRRSSPLHPKTGAMTYGWLEMVAAFRESVLSDSRGWNYTRDSGLEYTVNSDLGLSIIITSGDKDTGLLDGFPKTKNCKGAATEDLVSRNLNLFSSNDFDIHSETEENSIDSTKTYVFLYFFDHATKEVRCELSLPSGMNGFNGHNKIAHWSERIILPSVPFTAAIETPNKEFNDQIDIDVSRK